MLNLYFPHWYVGTPATIIFLWLVGRRDLKANKSGHKPTRWWSNLTLAALGITAASLIYVLGNFSTAVIALSLFALFPYALSGQPIKKIRLLKFSFSPVDWWLRSASVLGLIGLVSIPYTHRTTGVLNSPWQILPVVWFLLLYALTTACTVTAALRTPQKIWRYILIAVHLLVTYSVTLILYPLGFGFDAFIHRATESWILQHGFITPRNIIYAGQYVSVVWLTRLTSLPLFILDVWFVPVLAALLLPGTTRSLYTRVWQLSEPTATALAWLYPILFFLWVGLTTPYNFVLLFTFVTVAAAVEYAYDLLPALPPLALASAGVVTHPLLGGPLLVLVLTIILYKKNASLFQKSNIWTWFGSGVYVCIVSAVPVILFLAYLFLHQQSLPLFDNPFTKINFWFKLFQEPSPYWQRAPVGMLLYWFDRLIGPLLVLIGGLALWFFRSTTKKSLTTHTIWLIPLTSLGLLGSSFLLRSWIVFPEVGLSEQGDYPLRLIKASVFFILPWAGLAVGRFAEFFYQKKSISKKIISVGLVSCLLTVSFYISYPQKNAKGYNVTAADLAATTWIQHDNQEYNYIVLANPITAVAALSQYSFAKYFSTALGPAAYYSIPSGSYLFSLYTKMCQEGPSRALMNQAMDFAGVKKSYFVINSYWAKFPLIVEQAKQTANSWQSIAGGEIFVFTYWRD